MSSARRPSAWSCSSASSCLRRTEPHSPTVAQTGPMQPRVGIANLDIHAAPDGSFTIGQEAFLQFSWYARLGVHVQSDQVRLAKPEHIYVETALTALVDACGQL